MTLFKHQLVESFKISEKLAETFLITMKINTKEDLLLNGLEGGGSKFWILLYFYQFFGSFCLIF